MQGKNINEKTLIGHIYDLKSLIMHLGLLFGTFFSICWYFSSSIMRIIIRYFVPQGYNLNYFTLESIFFTDIRIAFFTAIICFIPVALPRLLIYFRCLFVSQSIQVLIMYCVIACALFICGILIGIFAIMPKFIIFMLNMAHSAIDVKLNVSSFINTSMIVVIIAGLLFQIPLLFFILVRHGIITADGMRRSRKAYIISSFIFAAIVTPPDVFSQVIVALFLICTFESMLLISKFFKKTDA